MLDKATMRSGFRLSIATAVALATTMSLACGSSPTSPSSSSSSPAPLGDGRFTLSITGDSGRCQDIKNPNVGTNIQLSLVGTHDGSTWIGRGATPQDGSIELRLAYTQQVTPAPSGPAGTSGSYVAGTMSGSASDTVTLSNRTVTIVDDTTISGVFRPLPRFADGYTAGAVTFSRDGVTSTCPAGASTWFISGPF